MSDEEKAGAAQEEGRGAETPPQDTSPSGGPDGEHQDSSTGGVEPGADNQQAPAAQRGSRRASQYYEDRKWRRTVNSALVNQGQLIERLLARLEKADGPEAAGGDGTSVDIDTFLRDPGKVLSERERKLLGRIEALESDLNSWRGSQAEAERSRNQQAALEILFPKGEDSFGSLESRIAKNPGKADKIMSILRETGLDEFSKTNPTQAATLVLRLLEGRSSPGVIPKSLMRGSAGGNPSGGQQSAALDQKRTELKRLVSETERDPSLRFDEKHKTMRRRLMSEIAGMLAKE